MNFKILSLIILLSSFCTGLKSQWILTGNPDSFAITEIAVKDNFIFAGTQTSGVFRSDNNGANWIAVNSGLNSTYVTDLTVTNNGIFASTGSGVFYSTNYGDSWISAGGGLSGGLIRKLTSRNNDVFAGHILAGVFKSTNNGSNWTRYALGEGDKLFTILATPSEFYISIANSILRSTNDGKSFEYIGNGITNFWAMTLSSYQNDLYAGTNDGIFYSSNIGDNWSRVDNGLTDTVINVIVNKNTNVFAGSQRKGVFLSTNKGNLWTSISTGLIDTNITAMAVSSDHIFAGSANGNIWRRPLSEIPLSVNVNSSSVISDYEIIGNYPNPFNPSTKILFSVNKNYHGKASIKIYDALGELILYDKIRVSGNGKYEYNWSPHNLSSGVYFYTVEIENTLLESKLVLLK